MHKFEDLHCVLGLNERVLLILSVDRWPMVESGKCDDGVSATAALHYQAARIANGECWWESVE